MIFLFSFWTERFKKSWNTCVKLIYRVLRNIFTYLVESYLAEGRTNFRNQIYAWYAGFYRGLLRSQSREVRGVAKIVANDPRSSTSRNLKLIASKSGLDQPQRYANFRVKTALKPKPVPENEQWRLGLLGCLFKLRAEKLFKCEDSSTVCAMIDSLCST